jgi:hypothetical protein
LLFGALATAAAAGGLYHGGAECAALGPAIWKFTLVAMGVAAFASANLGAELAFGSAAQRRLRIATSAGLVGYAVAVGAGASDFLWAVTATGAGTLFLLACCCIGPADRARSLLGTGLLLSLGGGVLQQIGVDLHPSFDHNALYHAIQMVAMLLCFAGIARLARSAAEDPRC